MSGGVAKSGNDGMKSSGDTAKSGNDGVKSSGDGMKSSGDCLNSSGNKSELASKYSPINISMSSGLS